MVFGSRRRDGRDHSFIEPAVVEDYQEQNGSRNAISSKSGLSTFLPGMDEVRLVTRPELDLEDLTHKSRKPLSFPSLARHPPEGEVFNGFSVYRST